MTLAITHWRYVPHTSVAAYEALGWRDKGEVPGHHGIYSHWMEWPHADDPQSPSMSAGMTAAESKAKA